MSRKKGPPMITIRNEACIEKMSDCELQEVLDKEYIYKKYIYKKLGFAFSWS
jgi:hypothetical protein